MSSSPPNPVSNTADDELTQALTTAARIRAEILDPLRADFVAKDEVIDLLGVCLLAGENLFLLGPPGTAKSAIVRALAARLDGRYFDYLLTRFTEPGELFGPFDIRRLREGELLTNTEGMLPEAEVIFLDELLNANSAILNSLLMALNERVFRRGRETRKLDFVLTVGASNRLPEDESLKALFDRFLLRVNSNNVPDDQLSNVLAAGWRLQQQDAAGHVVAPTISVAAIRQVRRSIALVNVADVRETYVALIQRLRHAGIEVSDRRAVCLQRLAAASAIICGRTVVDTSDLWILKYIWDTAEQVDVLAKIVDDAIAAAAADRPSELQKHPRSTAGQLPDPEAIARTLDQIESQLAASADNAARRSVLRDQLSHLAARIEWIAVEESRSFLRLRVQRLLGSTSPEQAAP